MTPADARQQASMWNSQADAQDASSVVLRHNARLLNEWADIMDVAIAANYTPIMPNDLAAAVQAGTYVAPPPPAALATPPVQVPTQGTPAVTVVAVPDVATKP